MLSTAPRAEYIVDNRFSTHVSSSRNSITLNWPTIFDLSQRGSKGLRCLLESPPTPLGLLSVCSACVIELFSVAAGFQEFRGGGLRFLGGLNRQPISMLLPLY